MHPEDCVQTIVNMYNMQDSNNTLHSRKSIMYLIYSVSHTYSQRHSELPALHENVSERVNKANHHVSSARVWFHCWQRCVALRDGS